MLAAPQNTAIQTGPLWLVFFSVVISANFSNTVFIAERIHGILEILLTCGLSRRDILFGKFIFVAGMSYIIGLVCIAFSFVWHIVLYNGTEIHFSINDLLLYGAAVFMNTASSAYLSIRMINPRMLHLANILLLGSLVTVYSVVTCYIPISSNVLSFILVLIGIIGIAAARRLYESEKIIQPVHW